MDGTNRLAAARINTPPAPAGWRIAGAADVDHSGKPDLLWQHEDGSLAYWLLNGADRVGAGRLVPGAVDPLWRVVGPKNHSLPELRTHAVS